MKKMRKKTIPIPVPDGTRNIDIRRTGPKGELKVSLEVSYEEDFTNQEYGKYVEEYFPIVKASKLSVDDYFLKHKPETKLQKKFKEDLIYAIKSGLVDFRAQRMDPSIDEYDHMYFHERSKPAVDYDATTLLRIVRKFLPERGSRIGSNRERIAFLGVLMKAMIEGGDQREYVWRDICDEVNIRYDEGRPIWTDEGPRDITQCTGYNLLIGKWYDLCYTGKYTINEETARFSVFGGEGKTLVESYELMRSTPAGWGEITPWVVIPMEEPVYVNKEKFEYLEKYFPIVRASTLSLEDEFLKHEPKTRKQKNFKKDLIYAIKSGLVDFRAQRMDPSIDGRDNICYMKGARPAIGKDLCWWIEKAKDFMPEEESRLGRIEERNAFWGLMIKYLIENRNYTISDAWEAVCDKSDGYDKNERTGSRQIGEWCDLGNTQKIVVRNKESACEILVCGDDFSFVEYENNPRIGGDGTVGWIVIPI